MVQTVKRPLFVLVAVGVLGAAAVGAAVAAPGHGRFTGRAGAFHGFGPGLGAGFGGFFGGRPGGFGGLGPGPRGGGLLGADVLTPAASFLGVSVATLASDLNSGTTLAQEATAKGKTATDLINAIVAAEKTVLDNEKAAGWLTEAQETSVLGVLTDEITALVDNGPGIPSMHRQPGLLRAAASYLGVSLSTLQSDLRSGKTLADEAAANGKTVDGLVGALTAQAKTSLDAAVAAGTITQAQENAQLNAITQRVTDLVNNAKLGSQKMTRLQVLFRH